MGAALDWQEAVGRVFGWVRNQNDPFWRSEPRLLAGNLDPLLTLCNTLPISDMVIK